MNHISHLKETPADSSSSRNALAALFDGYLSLTLPSLHFLPDGHSGRPMESYCLQTAIRSLRPALTMKNRIMSSHSKPLSQLPYSDEAARFLTRPPRLFINGKWTQSSHDSTTRYRRKLECFLLTSYRFGKL
ncbi:hypothetical protein [Celeribacter indicus]|uniref:hypothetical protein n=1 Tax=Celeribacter indicus TaxID=1208324 RepID=UPI001114F11B|nr:hypothetical protein [Celeribacter indicus]